MQRTIEKNWPRYPHPQLAALLRTRAADPVDACKQIEKLCAGNEDAPVSRLVMAEAALAADIWGEARRNLMALISRGQVTQIVYRLMARLERRESGDEQAALQWMTKAADAPADPAWLCHACGGMHKEWQALCAHCGSFNTLDWQSPGVSRGQAADIGTREPEIVGELVSPRAI
jgi:HemY protein